MSETITLGIESSCDETAVAVLQGGRKLLSNVISTQIPIHRKYGGVVPEIASRKHIVNIMPVLDEALTSANIKLSDIDQVAVTYGPGLQGALLVGLSAAKALAFAIDKPLIGVNHLEGHIFANFLSEEKLEPPFVSLVVSGGHTSLVEVRDYNEFLLMGETRDDAAGEAFDKVARVMGLRYPGGPEIDKLAKEGNPFAVDFPKALRNEGYDFSFSGLKSAVLNYLNSKKLKHEEVNKADIAASFQEAVIEILVEKAMQAMERTKLNTLALAGGVAANSALGAKLKAEAAKRNYGYISPKPILCTDNAAMIACRGYYQGLAGIFSDLYLNAEPALALKSTRN